MGRPSSDIAAETERVREIQDNEAPRYDRQISFFERALFGGGREWICSQARGDVLELAAGTLRNLPHYPQGVKLTAVELSPEMAAIGRKRAQEAGRPVDLRVGDVQKLDFPDESFDTVTCTLGFCTIPDTTAAAREAFRVLRPGGGLLLLEHVRSPVRAVRGVERVLGATLRPLHGRQSDAGAARLPARRRLRDRRDRALEMGDRRATAGPQAPVMSGMRSHSVRRRERRWMAR